MQSRASLPALAALGMFVCLSSGEAFAAGVLRPASAAAQPIELRDHQVRVLVNNGYARTEVRQVFHNPNPVALDAVYEFPVPPDAALSEMSIELGDRALHGEVVERDRAREIYDREAAAGNQAGLAVQNGYQNFQFSIAAVPAGGEATMSFVYYEAVTIDTGVGRVLYPLQNGGTDSGSSFWTGETTVTGQFSFDLELKSAAPIAEVRVPDVPTASITTLGEGHYKVHFDAAPGTLERDVVAYYRLADGLPGGVEVIPYRAATGTDPGTFMLIVTPGIDLAPLEQGSDYVFVLDFSGSMDTKIDTLKQAVARALLELRAGDRFQLIGFSDSAFEITSGLVSATPENVASARAALSAQGLLGGTNLYEGLRTGMTRGDPERVTSVFLVTDAVANQGVIAPIEFDRLLRASDVRVFGFLMSNSANWPLMEIITETSGGFYAPVSNQDDVLGQVLLMKSKLTHESLYDTRLAVSGCEVFDTTDFDFGKVYRGEQLVVFGRYAAAGQARMQLSARIGGGIKQYLTTFALPEVSEASPELERLWALELIHAVEKQALLGLTPAAEAAAKVRELGLSYQLVTAETSMLVLDDAGFVQNGVARDNQARTATEQGAQQSGAGQPPTNHGVGNPFPSSSPSIHDDGSSHSGDDYGGALDPGSVALLLFSILGLGARRSRRAQEPERA